MFCVRMHIPDEKDAPTPPCHTLGVCRTGGGPSQDAIAAFEETKTQMINRPAIAVLTPLLPSTTGSAGRFIRDGKS